MVSIVLAGVGGQGVITVANLIGRAAVIDGKNVLMTELHGMAQRGGRILVELRIGNYKSPIIPEGRADVLLGFEELEAARNIHKLSENGILLVNRRRIHPVPRIVKVMEYPEEPLVQLERRGAVFIEADSIALQLGNKKVVNTIMAGSLFSTGMLPLSEDSLKDAIREVFGKYSDINMRAFEEGRRTLPALQQRPV